MKAAPNASRRAIILVTGLAAAGACGGRDPETTREFAAALEPCDPDQASLDGCSPAFDQCALEFRICWPDAQSPTGWSWQTADCRTQVEEDGAGWCPERDGYAARCEAPAEEVVCGATSCVYTYDSDEDGLSDAEEQTGGTSPGEADSDGDGCSDGDEIALETDPLDPDSDDDGLEDCFEALLETDPLRPDSDGDELLDAIEIADGTDPLRADSDADLLLDAAEAEAGTDPHDPDSDDDGYADGIEVQAGTDPTDPASHPDDGAPPTDGGVLDGGPSDPAPDGGVAEPIDDGGMPGPDVPDGGLPVPEPRDAGAA